MPRHSPYALISLTIFLVLNYARFSFEEFIVVFPTSQTFVCLLEYLFVFLIAFTCFFSLFNFQDANLNASRSAWWAQVDSNHRPHAYQACALTTWAMRPFRLKLTGYSFFLYPLAFRLWWRWGGSNSWPPACKAGALPAELHPHFFQGLRIAILFPSFFKFLKVP